MREFFKKYHIWMKLLALVVAVILWAIVIVTENPERKSDFSDIEVQLIGEETLRNKYDLAVADGEAPTITIKIEGKFSKVSSVEKSDITARADISGYTESGTYSIGYDISLPDGVTVASRSPSVISVTLDDIITKELPVKVEYVGELEEGIRISEAIVNPASVKVTGLAGELENATAATVTLEADQLTDTFTGTMDYVITDDNGNEVETSQLTRVDPTVDVEVPVTMVREVPLSVDVEATSGVPAEDAVVDIDPSYVRISGSPSDVRNLESISIGTVDIDSFLLTYDRKFSVMLPDSIYFADDDDEVKSAQVHVSLENIETSSYVVNDISFINKPENMDVSLVTQNVTITLRGEEDKLKAISEDNISIVVDLSVKAVYGGQQIFPVQVIVDGEGVDVCGAYSVTIDTVESGG